MNGKTKTRALFVTAALVLGGTAAMAQGNEENGRGGVGRRPSNLPTVPARGGPRPALPPELIEATERRAAAEARGEHIPMRVWDPATGDMMRHPDGSFVWDTELPGYKQPPPPPCASTPEGCGR